ncbi:hypothetical protein BKN38_03495 [Helicobacter sp. CLO-3]|uniref:energy transducer TonB n=1 Tax=unclassified Helicobacter TaxID=2593540 RepID=UPI000805F355|nr:MULTISPECIES: energy transducer TonB [unclassified Helicobacter]OBV28708.1 hypothetical protein BA723_08480 [Helicobacter sp. CLO-3]OHU84209.1 hypothetical protein BKN38_03495 [Helicobacter sp. CLO-3]
MKTFQSLRNRIENPLFLGFLCSLIVHAAAAAWFLDIFSRQESIAEVGASNITMSLASVNTNANQKAYSTPVQEKPKPKKKHKKHEKKHKTKHPIPTQEKLVDDPEEASEEVVEKVVEQTTKQAPTEEESNAASNQDSQGSTQELLAYNEGISDEFYRKVQEAIKKKHHYPRLARIRELTGTVTVEFIINMDGSIERLKIHHSNTGDILNQQALKTIQEAHKKFPTPPKRVLLKIPIEYELES